MNPVASTMPISDSIVIDFFLLKHLVPLMHSTVDLVKKKKRSWFAPTPVDDTIE